MFGNIQLATLSLKDCILFPHSNDLHSGEINTQLTTFQSFLSLVLLLRSERSERAATYSGFKKNIYIVKTNSRIEHFLPECIAFNQNSLRHFYQSALRHEQFKLTITCTRRDPSWRAVYCFSLNSSKYTFNGHQTLKSDEMSFRVHHSSIL